MLVILPLSFGFTVCPSLTCCVSQGADLYERVTQGSLSPGLGWFSQEEALAVDLKDDR